MAAFQCTKGAYEKDRKRLFTKAATNKTKGNIFKLEEGRFRFAMSKIFFLLFTVSVVVHWNRLPGKVVDALSLEVFKVRLNMTLSNLI